MLSSSTENDLRNRQQQHRRQHSIPTKLEPAKASCLPNIRKPYGHRRGLSLDHRRPTSSQNRMVSSINTGYTTSPQHNLRETQQQKVICPGQVPKEINDHDGYLSSLITTPHRHSLDGSYLGQYDREQLQQSPSYPHFAPTSWNIGENQGNAYWSNNCNLYPANPSISSQSNLLHYPSLYGHSAESSLLDKYDESHTSSRKINERLLDGVNGLENLALKSPYRPLTPLDHISDGCCFPLTPTDMPDNTMKQEPVNARFLDSYDTSMEETIKPSNKQRAGGNIFDDMRKAAEENSKPHYPGSDSTGVEDISYDSASSITVENIPNYPNFHMELPRLRNEGQFDPDSLFSPKSDISSVPSAYDSSPEESQIGIYSDPFTVVAQDPFLEPNGSSSASLPFPYLANLAGNDAITSLTTRRGSTAPNSSTRSRHRRFDSTSTINLDESITETGITTDHIASYISGPDPVDGGKWSCLYPGCRKRFGRKENIKSHVQTHLGDRQFQCPFCRKCFVRQHDLKRHAKIHSGVKPYPCRCGNSFARHDALTRHRQRGMCIGAFEGTVKKAAKRGRPRKHRPDDEERHDKSVRTQRKNQEVLASSSVSGCSESGGFSPRSDLGEVTGMKSNSKADILQDSLAIEETDFKFMPSSQVSDTANDQYAPTLLSAIERPTPSSISHSQLMCYTESISDKTKLLQDIGAHQNESSINSLESSSRIAYEGVPSPVRSMNTYFDLDDQSNGLNINGLPDFCNADKAYVGVFSATNQPPQKHVRVRSIDRNRADSVHNHDHLTEKIADSFGSATPNEVFFTSPQGVYFGTP